jgi:hypothetical protein
VANDTSESHQKAESTSGLAGTIRKTGSRGWRNAIRNNPSRCEESLLEGMGTIIEHRNRQSFSLLPQQFFSQL